MNSLRRSNRRAELGLQIFWSLLVGWFVVMGSVGFFFAAYGLLQIQRPDLLDLPLWVIFLIWQLAPILFEGYSPGLNFREVARYPVAFRVYFFLNAGYGLSDPAAITSLLWLMSFWLGLAIARPEWAITAALALLLFALFNLLLNRIVIGLFDRFQSTRKGRERMVLVTFTFIILMNMLQLNARNWGNTRGVNFTVPHWVAQVFAAVREFSPPGMAERVFLRSGLDELAALGGLALCAGLAFLLLSRQLRALYQGEVYAETYTVRRELKVRKGLRLPLVDDVTAAIIEKELRYIRQSARLLLQLIYPPIIFFVFIFNGPLRKIGFGRTPEFLLAGLAGFMLLSVPNLSYNIFGMDKEGFGRWLLSPPPLRKVMMAKNLTHGGLLTSIYLIFAVIAIAISHVHLVEALTVTVGFFAILVIQLGAGNFISVHWPKRIELTQMSSKMSSNAAGLAALVVMIPLSALVGAIAFASWYWQLSWLPLLCGIIILAVSLKLYSLVLDWVAGYAWTHVEEITGNLGA